MNVLKNLNKDEGLKKKILIFGIIFFAFSVFYFLKINFQSGNTAANNNLAPVDQTVANVSGSLQPSDMDQKELQEYYLIYNNPFVIHIRKALNSYLNGTNVGIDRIAIDGAEGENFLNGLKSFDKNYYISRFVVFFIGNSIVGGKEITIEFLDKPDKIFTAWVYELANGDYELRGFWQNPTYVGAKLNELNQKYKYFLEDKTHSL